MANPAVLTFDEVRARLSHFDTLIDVRSPGEYADDHLPGAINLPVLDDEQRARVGTLHVQTSAFDARRLGAALVASNIAHHLETRLADQPREWRPLIYCWRGGQRSASMAHILARVGWHVVQLEGGYKAFRRAVREELETLPQRFSYQVLSGMTGSGKSRLLETLERQGAQVLDLEALARHRGSLLGNLPDAPQPGQKAFETAIWHRLNHFKPDRPVFVESESRRIGALRVPEALMQTMRASPCCEVHLPQAERIRLLCEDYQHLMMGDANELLRQLEQLLPLHGREVLTDWHRAIAAGEWTRLVAELLERHYDPSYRRSTARNYSRLAQARPVPLQSIEPQAFSQAANDLIAALDVRTDVQALQDAVRYEPHRP